VPALDLGRDLAEREARRARIFLPAESRCGSVGARSNYL